MKLSWSSCYSSYHLFVSRQGTCICFRCLLLESKKTGINMSPHLLLLGFLLLHPTADGPVLAVSDGVFVSFALHPAVAVLWTVLILKEAPGFEKRRQIHFTVLLICYYFLCACLGWGGWLLFFKGFVFTTSKICVWQLGLHVGSLTIRAEAVSDSVAFGSPSPSWAALSGFSGRGCT